VHQTVSRLTASGGPVAKLMIGWPSAPMTIEPADPLPSVTGALAAVHVGVVQATTMLVSPIRSQYVMIGLPSTPMAIEPGMASPSLTRVMGGLAVLQFGLVHATTLTSAASSS